jgi:hypothetical protein
MASRLRHQRPATATSASLSLKVPRGRLGAGLGETCEIQELAPGHDQVTE